MKGEQEPQTGGGAAGEERRQWGPRVGRSWQLRAVSSWRKLRWADAGTPGDDGGGGRRGRPHCFISREDSLGGVWHKGEGLSPRGGSCALGPGHLPQAEKDTPRNLLQPDPSRASPAWMEQGPPARTDGCGTRDCPGRGGRSHSTVWDRRSPSGQRGCFREEGSVGGCSYAAGLGRSCPQTLMATWRQVKLAGRWHCSRPRASPQPRPVSSH